MKYIITMLCLLPLNMLFGGELSDYMNTYKVSQKSDYNSEKQIIENYSFTKLASELETFYNDSLLLIRKKAYYFIYKKGLLSKEKHQQTAVLKLIQGCSDVNGGIIGQSLSYLQDFPVTSFNETARMQINSLLLKKRVPHLKKLAMLAGYIGTGEETMRKKLLLPDINVETRWFYSLALARLGSSEHAAYCVSAVKKMPVNNDLVTFILPDLIYTRQSEAIIYCVEILNQDTKNCYSPNPDKPDNILCGYFIMELLAPVIIDFPYKTDATGSLNTVNYEKALKDIRQWFKENPDFTIRTDVF